MKKKILLIMLLTPIMMSCNNSHQGNVSDEEYEEAIITTPPAPDIATLRRNIREYGDTMSLEKYLMYYPGYLPTDNDSLLYYSRLMAHQYAYNRAYYIMFSYWVNKYNESKMRLGIADVRLIDSAMTCLYEGAQRGVKSCNVLLATLYANGIYFDRDTSLSNDCLRKAGCTNVTDLRKSYEDYYRRRNLEIFMKEHGRHRLGKEDVPVQTLKNR